MMPFLEIAGGRFQEASILVEVHVDTLKLVGACEGTAKEQFILNPLPFELKDKQRTFNE